MARTSSVCTPRHTCNKIRVFGRSGKPRERHQGRPRELYRCHINTVQYPSAPERERALTERRARQVFPAAEYWGQASSWLHRICIYQKPVTGSGGRDIISPKTPIKRSIMQSQLSAFTKDPVGLQEPSSDPGQWLCPQYSLHTWNSSHAALFVKHCTAETWESKGCFQQSGPVQAAFPRQLKQTEWHTKW